MAKRSKLLTKDALRLPRRHINKITAVRQLIHSAIRLIFIGEDPFAVHLLVQSAEKIINDISKKRCIKLEYNLKEGTRPEKANEFFGQWRLTYNYFKHADSDADELLGIYDISELNILMTITLIHQFQCLVGAMTNHMRIFLSIVFPFLGNSQISDSFYEPAQSIITATSNLSVRDYFAMSYEFHANKIEFQAEKLQDLQDVDEFYQKLMSEIGAKR